MNSFKERVSGISLYDVKSVVRKTQNVIHNYSEVETLIRAATNTDPWEISNSEIGQLSSRTNNYNDLHKMMNFIFKKRLKNGLLFCSFTPKLQDTNNLKEMNNNISINNKKIQQIRSIRKTIKLLIHLIKLGSSDVIRIVSESENINIIQSFQSSFRYVDLTDGNDHGKLIRDLSEQIIKLVEVRSYYLEEREESLKQFQRYINTNDDYNSNPIITRERGKTWSAGNNRTRSSRSSSIISTGLNFFSGYKQNNNNIHNDFDNDHVGFHDDADASNYYRDSYDPPTSSYSGFKDSLDEFSHGHKSAYHDGHKSGYDDNNTNPFGDSSNDTTYYNEDKYYYKENPQYKDDPYDPNDEYLNTDKVHGITIEHKDEDPFNGKEYPVVSNKYNKFDEGPSLIDL